MSNRLDFHHFEYNTSNSKNPKKPEILDASMNPDIQERIKAYEANKNKLRNRFSKILENFRLIFSQNKNPQNAREKQVIFPQNRDFQNSGEKPLQVNNKPQIIDLGVISPDYKNHPRQAVDGKNTVSMQEIFADESLLLDLAKRYQQNDVITIREYHKPPSGGRYEHGYVVDSQTIFLNTATVTDEATRKSVLKNEMAHIILNQAGFGTRNNPIFEANIPMDGTRKNTPITGLHIHELVSDYASISVQNPDEIKRQISGVMLYFFLHVKWDEAVRAGDFPGYLYTNQVGFQAIEKIFGNLNNFVNKYPWSRSMQDWADILYREMKNKIVNVNGQKIPAIEYFVQAKRNEWEQLLTQVVFPDYRQNGEMLA